VQTGAAKAMTNREHRIREIAHRLWEEEGRPHHQEKRHWDMAERLVHEEERAGAKSENGAKAEAGGKAAPARTTRAKAATPRPRKKTAGS